MAGIYIIARKKSIRIEYNSLSSVREISGDFEFYQAPFHVIALSESLGVKVNTVFNEFDITPEIINAIEKVQNLDGSIFDLNEGVIGNESNFEIIQKRSKNLVNWLNDFVDEL